MNFYQNSLFITTWIIENFVNLVTFMIMLAYLYVTFSIDFCKVFKTSILSFYLIS